MNDQGSNPEGSLRGLQGKFGVRLSLYIVGIVSLFLCMGFAVLSIPSLSSVAVSNAGGALSGIATASILPLIAVLLLIQRSDSLKERQRVIEREMSDALGVAGGNAGHTPAGGHSDTEMLISLFQQQSDGHARAVVKYYAQGHRQAAGSFILSMVFAGIGFSFILVAVVLALENPEAAVQSTVTGLVGLINQAVSILFFRRADKAQSFMMQLIDKLRVDREKEVKFLAGLIAIEHLSPGNLQDAMRAATALELTGCPVTIDQIFKLSECRTTRELDGLRGEATENGESSGTLRAPMAGPD